MLPKLREQTLHDSETDNSQTDVQTNNNSRVTDPDLVFEIRSGLDPGFRILGDPEVTASLYCNFAYLYWFCSIYLR